MLSVQLSPGCLPCTLARHASCATQFAAVHPPLDELDEQLHAFGQQV